MGHRVSRALRYNAARVISRLPDALKIAMSGEPRVTVDGQQLDPMVQVLRTMRRKQGYRSLIQPSVDAGRRRYRRDTHDYRGPMTQVHTVRDFEIAGPSGAVPVRLYVPPDAPSTASLLVYAHGGGFVIGDLETHDEPCRLLCRQASTLVLSVAYRLAPEHPFPAALDDVTAAYLWAREHASELGCHSARVAIGGDSAGGHLAAVVSLTVPRSQRPVAQLLIYPATDIDTARPSHALFGEGYVLTLADRDAFYRMYAGATTTDPRLSPVQAGDLRDAPPTLIAVAGFDVLRDEGDAYAAALRAVGVPVRLERFASFEHGFIHLSGVCGRAKQAVEHLGASWRAFIDAQ
jgi:acetyl esterase